CRAAKWQAKRTDTRCDPVHSRVSSAAFTPSVQATEDPMLVSCFTQFRSELPVLEPDRFYAGPRDRRRSGVDAQARALDRLIRNCEHLRPHLRSPDALEHFIDAQRHPAR